MPVYEFCCGKCKSIEDRFLKLADFDTAQYCQCGELMKRLISAPFVVATETSYYYNCPITGKEIRGKSEHEENLRKHGCRLLEKGEDKDAAAFRKKEEEKLLDPLVETLTRKISELPPETQAAVTSVAESTTFTTERSTL